jgi:hypothetical protein
VASTGGECSLTRICPRRASRCFPVIGGKVERSAETPSGSAARTASEWAVTPAVNVGAGIGDVGNRHREDVGSQRQDAFRRQQAFEAAVRPCASVKRSRTPRAVGACQDRASA